jgi:hypothetical protein
MFDDQNERKEKSDVRKRMEEFYSQLSKQDIEFFTGMMRKRNLNSRRREAVQAAVAQREAETKAKAKAARLLKVK